MDTYIYQMKDAIYINLTNRCTNNCAFCIRNEHNGFGGYDLRLEKEPEAADLINELEKQAVVEKVVFCGMGEPMMRLGVLLETAKYLKARGAHIRVNTNGQGSVYAKRNIAKEIRGLVDTVSISLNASNAAEYQKACCSVYEEQAYTYLLNFAKSCIDEGIETVLSVVDIIGKDEVEKCSLIAKKIGAKFRVRHFVD